jgi:hypothetical protein
MIIYYKELNGEPSTYEPIEYNKIDFDFIIDQFIS